MEDAVYRNVEALEPLMPTSQVTQLGDLACDILRESSRLSGRSHPIVRRALAEALRLTNSYYSQLIEGHFTSPADIERALTGSLLADPASRNLQIENTAHIETQREMEARLAAEPSLDPLSPEFLQWLHGRFYRDVPQDLRFTMNKAGVKRSITVGDFRLGLVDIDQHLAPAPEVIRPMLSRMAREYAQVSGQLKTVAIAAAHHRLLWVHPFDDGNGRVARLVAHAMAIRARIDADGLWSISRGLARKRDLYRDALSQADQQRHGSHDGRGNLSDQGLAEFCVFFLETMLDQIRFIDSCLDFDALSDRIRIHVAFGPSTRKHGGPINLLVREALTRGEFPRGEAGRIIGKSQRTGQTILGIALKSGLLTSTTEKSPVRIAFPMAAMEAYFPSLFAPGTDQAK